MFLAICGGLLLHILPNRLLMVISQAGFLTSVLLFALIPDRNESGDPSLSHLYWAFVFPAMICSTIGVDITFNVTNVFITTAMPQRLQSAASGVINSLLYLGLAFWLGIGELAVSTAVEYQGAANVSQSKQFRIGFWLGVGLAAVSLILTTTVRMGTASADMTADEKADLQKDQATEKTMAEGQAAEKMEAK
jgi:MFS family permease